MRLSFKAFNCIIDDHTADGILAFLLVNITAVNHAFLEGRGLLTGLSLALVHSSTSMLKSVRASDFWKPLVHTNMSKILGNIDDDSTDKSDFDCEE